MDDGSVTQCLQDLHHPDSTIRDLATQALWEHWFWQKGATGFAQLQRAQVLLETGEVKAAAALLTQLITELPDFAEAWNRRAVLHYSQQRHEAAIKDCEVVIRLVPFHFGALHGLGLCQAALGDYQAAISTFRRALAVQPHALINQKLLLECLALL
jgi:tetratricopeptide (TPR) repeat protein